MLLVDKRAVAHQRSCDADAGRLQSSQQNQSRQPSLQQVSMYELLQNIAIPGIHNLSWTATDAILSDSF